MRLFSLSLFLFTPLINANGADILEAISKISNATIALNKTVTSFPNNALLGLTDIVPLLIDSGSLLHDINEATDVANASANLTIAEATEIADATIALGAVVESSLATIVSAKPKFDKLLIVSPTVLLNLKLEWAATDKFGVTVVNKVPTALQAIAETLLAPIDEAFNNTVAVYS